MVGNPYRLADSLGSRRSALGAASMVGRLAPIIAACIALPFLRDNLLSFAALSGAARSAGAVGAMVRVALLLAAVLALRAYDLVVRGPDRGVVDLHPVRAAPYVRARLWRALREGAPASAAAAVVLVPVWPDLPAFCGGIALLLGAWAAGVGVGVGVNLAAPALGADPRFADALDVVRGQNPRTQAALVWAPAVTLAGVGLSLVGAAGGLDGLDLGRQICGLLNSNVGHGRIVLENLPASGGGVPWLGRQTPVSQQLENLLAREAGRLTPPPVLPAPQFIQVRDAQLAIITVPKTTAPVTLYHEAAYVWDGAALTRLDPRAALRRYLTYAGFPDEIEPGAGAVHLEYARLARPIAPPATLGQPTDVQRAADDEAAGLQARVHAIGRYESQLYAQVWTSTAFQRQPQTGGFALKLTLPLQQMALALDAAGQLTMNEPLIVEGEIGVMLDGLLASGIGVTRQAVAGTQNADGGSAWLDQLPILKQTRLRVRYRADLRDLFRQRTRTTVLDFYLPDVSLDGERVQDILQACADLGFRIAEVDGPRADPNDATVNQAVIRGVRSEGYADIHLFLLAQCRRRPITRQLRFAGQRFDSKETQSALLNVTAAFWATASGNPYPVTVPRANVGPDEERVAASDEVARAMAQIQIALHELLSQRFQHLRTE